MSPYALLLAAGILAICPVAPLIPPAPIIAILFAIGSTRWTHLPPRSTGLLLTFLALLLLSVTSRSSRWQSRDQTRVAKGSAFLSVVVCLFIAWMAISLFWTPPMSVAYGSEKTLRLVMFDLLPAFVLISMHRRESGVVTQFVRWAAIACQLVALASLLLSAKELTHANLGAGLRLNLLGTDPITLGMLAAIGLTSTFDAAAAPWLHRSAIGRSAKWLLRLICGLAVVASASKSILLGLALTVLLAIVWMRPTGGQPQQHRQFRATHALAVAIVAIVAILLVPAPFLLRLEPSSFVPGASSHLVSGSITDREALWADAKNFFVQSPIIGGGVGSYNRTNVVQFGVPTRGPDGVAYPHDFVLETAAELGVVGLGLLTLMLAAAFQAARAGLRTNITLTTAVCVGLTRAIFTGDLSDHRVLIYGIAAAICIANEQPASYDRPQRIRQAVNAHNTTIASSAVIG